MIGRSHRTALVVVLAALSLAGTLSAGLSVGMPIAAAAPSVHAMAHATPAPLDLRPGGRTARPSILPLPCSSTLPWPVYGNVGDGWPPTPFISLQTGCGGTLFVGQDEVHQTFISSVAGSAARFTVPIHVPANATDASTMAGFYVEEVVSGDHLSPWNQSLLEVSFIPDATSLAEPHIQYLATVSVYSMNNYSSSPTAVCPSGWLSLAWNSSYWCEGSDFANASGYVFSTPVDGGDWVNVTLAGTPKTGPVQIWENDSTRGAASFDLTLNYSTTGTYNFTPAYSSSCEQCLLGWGMGEGAGLGIELCPTASYFFAGVCNTYNVYNWSAAPTVEFGIPEYWSGSSYSGDYAYLGFESTTGACSYIVGSSVISVALCVANTQGAGTGYYPYFTFNGSVEDFGTTYPWTTWDLGAASVQFNAAGTMTPKPPIYVDSIGDDSRGGYVAGGQSVTVTARYQAIGHLTNVSLNYELPGATSWTSVAMSQVNGTSSIGYFNATIPSTGGNGTIQYWVYGKDVAGVNTTSIIYDVVRGPLPTFGISLSINPKFCGTIDINGTAYRSGTVADLEPGFYSLGETGCYPYIHPVYFPSLKLNVLHNGTELLVRGNGQLELSYTFNPPTMTLQLKAVPSSCSALILIGGNSYSPGNTAYVTWNQTYLVSQSACAGYDFTGFTGTADVNVTVTPAGMTLVVAKNGTLTANYVASTSAFPILFLVAPGGCGGGIRFDGAVYENDTTLQAGAGTFPIAPVTCPLDGFENWSLGGGASVSDGNLTLSSQATIELVQYYLTIITVLTYPATCGGFTIDGQNFTNGATYVVGNNTTHVFHPFTCPGYTVLGLQATRGLHIQGDELIANGSGDLEMSATNGTLPVFVGFETSPAGCGTIGFNGQVYQDTNYTFVAPGSVVPLSDDPCTGYGLLRWVTAGQITVLNNSAYINGSGSITAYDTPLASVFLETSPYGCGAIVLGGHTYAGNNSVDFPSGSNLSLAYRTCPGYTFERWVEGTGVVVNATYVIINANSQLEAVFVPQTFDVRVAVSPANCGNLFINAKIAYTGSTVPLAAGAYPIAIEPCQGDTLIGYDVSGNVSVVAGQLIVNGTGAVTVLLGPVPPAVTLAVPSSSAVGLSVSFAATIAVPIFPYNYTYLWEFGDGTTANTTVPSTYHSYGASGTYTVHLIVTDPLGRTAEANASITVAGSPASSTSSALVPVAIAIVAAIAVIAAAWWWSGRGGGREESSESEDGGSPTPALAGESESMYGLPPPAGPPSEGPGTEGPSE